MAKENMSFEQSMARLEAVVGQLERGEATLEQSLTLFEEGSGLIARCSGLLDQAEQTVRKLTRNAEGEPESKPFDRED